MKGSSSQPMRGTVLWNQIQVQRLAAILMAQMEWGRASERLPIDPAFLQERYEKRTRVLLWDER